MACCKQKRRAWIHDEKNPDGHFFDRNASPVRKVRRRRKRPSRSNYDYKWWATSYRRQRVIHDLVQEKIEAYMAGEVELEDVERAELAAIYVGLKKLLEARKRPPDAGAQWADGRWRFTKKTAG